MNKKLYLVVLMFLLLFTVSACSKKQDSLKGTVVDGNFSDNIVRVRLTNEATFKFKEYTASDFVDIGATSVVILNTFTIELAKKQALAEKTGDYSEIQKYVDSDRLLDLDKVGAILSITVEKRSKENLLRVIEILEKREDVEYAELNYYGTLG